MTQQVSRYTNTLDAWLLALTGRREQVTSTLYDIAYPGFVGDDRNFVKQRNLRNRVSAVSYAAGNNPSMYSHATFYTYDIHGNVDTLVQDYGLSSLDSNIMNKNGNRWKKIAYQYDLISGKVNMVQYQRTWGDQFFHRYSYDAENRLILVETSPDSLVWEKDARYEYYLHGPLARVTLGDQSVQGVDYAYTLQGWLKGVNSTGATAAYDMGEDGKAGSINQFTGRDAYGFNLNYYGGDYTAINATVRPFPGYSAYLNNEYRPLYNGNISSMQPTIRAFDQPNYAEEGNSTSFFYNFRYDQLNRLKAMDLYRGFNKTANQYDNLIKLQNGFHESMTYDANGNILTYNRNGRGNDAAMDRMKYQYFAGTNRLRSIYDSVPANKWGSNDWDVIFDIDNQDTLNGNYIYDEIGNLISDAAEGISSIKWNVYGKITEIIRGPKNKSNTIRINYSYDAQGNRIGKVETRNNQKLFTWYVRDAQGNLMSTYTSFTPLNDTARGLASLSLAQSEVYIYGSSRLGTDQNERGVDGGPWDAQQYYSSAQFFRGWKQYELTNHLGNVLTTISDKKISVSSGGSLIDYYEPQIVSATEYYAFGMPMRMLGSVTGKNYRYGFNGKENDNEVKGNGNQQDYGMRIYDPRVGRFLSVDPITKEYPELTPYQFASNTPIQAIDIDGLEAGGLNLYTPQTGKFIEEYFNSDLSEEGRAMAKGLMISNSGVEGNPTKVWQFWLLAAGQSGQHYGGSVPGSYKMKQPPAETPQSPKAGVTNTPGTTELSTTTKRQSSARLDRQTTAALGGNEGASQANTNRSTANSSFDYSLIPENKMYGSISLRLFKHAYNWKNASLTQVLKQFAPDATPEYIWAAGKAEYMNPNTGIKIVHDLPSNYFRIFDASGNPLGINGQPIQTGNLTGKAINNKIQAETHFLNTDGTPLPVTAAPNEKRNN